jgi:hypothetical protein
VAGDDARATGFWEAMAAEGWERDARAIRFTKMLHPFDPGQAHRHADRD